MYQAVRSGHIAFRPLQAGEVGCDDGGGIAGSGGAYTEHALREETRGAGRPAVAQANEGAHAVIRLEIEMKMLLGPRGIVALPEGCGSFGDHASPKAPDKVERRMGMAG